jgi:hypothetical protein
MLDHMLLTGNLLAHCYGAEIRNEVLHEESVAFGTDRNTPSPTTPRWWPPSSSGAGGWRTAMTFGSYRALAPADPTSRSGRPCPGPVV